MAGILKFNTIMKNNFHNFLCCRSKFKQLAQKIRPRLIRLLKF